MSPSISLRESIRWPPEPASEPTSTIVLTSEKRRFVDIRILHEATGSHKVNVQQETKEDLLPFERLEWGFAGTSESKVRRNDEGVDVVHSKWTHWIDSKHPQAELVVDEGDMYPDEGGEMSLEKGKMIRPTTGVMAEYEELWREVEPIVVGLNVDENAGTKHLAEDIQHDGTENQQRLSAVLIMNNDKLKLYGMVVRVGQYCQGIARCHDGLALEQWMWNEENGWHRRLRIGSLWLPCSAVMDGADNGTVFEGSWVSYGDFEWNCVELSKF